LRASGFVLGLSSPVLQKMLCGGFSESAARRVELEDVDGVAYSKVLDMWCGKEGLEEKELGDVLVLASVADRLEMAEVGAALEEAIIGQLNARNCGDVLMVSGRLGLGPVEAAACRLALERFEEVAGTAGFVEMDEAAVGRLLEDDRLCVSTEEAVFEGLVSWMRGGGCGLRGRGLLSKVRFGLMDREYLASQAKGKLGAEHAEWIDGLVAEALRVREGGLGAQGPASRIGDGVRWERCGDGLGRRLQGHTDEVLALVECEGRMCSGSLDGSIRVWSMASMEQERILYEEEGNAPYCLTAWNGLLLSGHAVGNILVWSVATRECNRELLGHAETVIALAASGSRLASGSVDGSVNVWAIGVEVEWSLERTLQRDSEVKSLAIWQDKVVVSSFEVSIEVWDMATGVHDATLTGHTGTVVGLVVHGDRLLSAGLDGAIREWAVGTWAALRAVVVRHLRCLTVSGSKLVCAPWYEDFDEPEEGGQREEEDKREVLVLDRQTFAVEHSFAQPAGATPLCLAAARGQVWGGVGDEVVVWGRD
jgi:hypothetical protein